VYSSFGAGPTGAGAGVGAGPGRGTSGVGTAATTGAGFRASGWTNGTPGISGILSVVPGARRGLGGSWLVSQITSDRERSP